MTDCPVCREPAQQLHNDSQPPDYDGKQIDCARCGRFDITGTACAMFESKDLERRLAALEKAKRWPGRGPIPEIHSHHI